MCSGAGAVLFDNWIRMEWTRRSGSDRQEKSDPDKTRIRFFLSIWILPFLKYGSYLFEQTIPGLTKTTGSGPPTLPYTDGFWIIDAVCNFQRANQCFWCLVGNRGVYLNFDCSDHPPIPPTYFLACGAIEFKPLKDGT